MRRAENHKLYANSAAVAADRLGFCMVAQKPTSCLPISDHTPTDIPPLFFFSPILQSLLTTPRCQLAAFHFRALPLGLPLRRNLRSTDAPPRLRQRQDFLCVTDFKRPTGRAYTETADETRFLKPPRSLKFRRDVHGCPEICPSGSRSYILDRFPTRDSRMKSSNVRTPITHLPSFHQSGNPDAAQDQ